MATRYPGWRRCTPKVIVDVAGFGWRAGDGVHFERTQQTDLLRPSGYSNRARPGDLSGDMKTDPLGHSGLEGASCTAGESKRASIPGHHAPRRPVYEPCRAEQGSNSHEGAAEVLRRSVASGVALLGCKRLGIGQQMIVQMESRHHANVKQGSVCRLQLIAAHPGDAAHEATSVYWIDTIQVPR